MIDLSSNGVVPITCLDRRLWMSPRSFSSVRLNNAAAVSTSIQDKDGDGLLDFSGRYRSSPIQLPANSTVATLVGRLTNGQAFQAIDIVKIVPGNLGHCQQ